MPFGFGLAITRWPQPGADLRLRACMINCHDLDVVVFKAHRLLYHSTLGLRAIKKKRKTLLHRLVPRQSTGRGCQMSTCPARQHVSKPKPAAWQNGVITKVLEGMAKCQFALLGSRFLNRNLLRFRFLNRNQWLTCVCPGVCVLKTAANLRRSR